MAPGGPLDIYAENPSVTPGALAHMRHAYGLDQLIPLQYILSGEPFAVTFAVTVRF